MPDDRGAPAQVRADAEARDLLLRPQIAVWALLALFGALVMASAAQDAAFFSGQMRERIWLLDVNSETSFYTWASSALIALNAVLLVLMAAADAKRRWAWAFLACLFALGSADEIVMIHERISGILSGSDVVPDRGVFHFAWVIPALIFVALVGAAYVPFLLSLPRRIALLLVLAGGIYIMGAVGFEMISGPLFENNAPMSPVRRIFVNTEEALEGLGQIVFFIAMIAAFRALSPRWRISLG